MICVRCGSAPARHGSDLCGACLREMAALVDEALTEGLADELGEHAASVTVGEDLTEYERRQRG